MSSQQIVKTQLHILCKQYMLIYQKETKMNQYVIEFMNINCH